MFVGELVERPATAPFVTLRRRRTACSAACPCAPIPRNAVEAQAILAARVRARDATCPVEETPYDPVAH